METEKLVELIQNTELNIFDHVQEENSPSISGDAYLAQLLDVQELPDDRKEQIKNNFIHLMGQVIKDLTLVNQRIDKYRTERQKLDGVKSNEAEFRRRKLEYFAKLNKNAVKSIVTFLSSGIKEYLLDLSYDTLQRESQGDELGRMYRNRRYLYAQFPDYYDADFDYSTVVKTTHMPGVDFLGTLENEKKFLELRQKKPEQYYAEIKKVVDGNDLSELLLNAVEHNYHLYKRKEVFSDLMRLFQEKHYQSFLNLGLLQLEGLFYDICSLKYEEKENAGTLVEKAEKALRSNNEISFMRLYPYFAFDVPIRRNEIAHTGLINTDNHERLAYELILDLYSVARMALLESDGKFRLFWMIHDKLYGENASVGNDSVYKALFYELFAIDVLVSDSFWEVLKKPELYKEEIEFYKVEDLKEGYVDLPSVVNYISSMVYETDFWEAIEALLDEALSDKFTDTRLFLFSKKMANNYVAVLEPEAKAACIEVLKKLKVK